ncbi:hypothetical protein [Isoptericola sp. NPDC057191]|uniref:hypothetical protein n=1 Tax=Isoptericola sp. NPDC057191 TaxID=3346041 RepID=UPI0036250CA8
MVGTLVALAAAGLVARALVRRVGRRSWILAGLSLAACGALLGVGLMVLTMGVTDDVGRDPDGNTSVEVFT